MNVVQLICGGSFGGAEAVGCSLASALRGRVARSMIYVVVESRVPLERQRTLIARVNEFDVPVRVIFTDRRVSWKLARDLRCAFREDLVDVAHSHSYKTAFWVPLIRGADRDAVQAVCFTLHGIDLPPSWGRAFLRSINTVGALGADALIACSHPIERHYQQFPLLCRKTVALLNGLRPEFAPPREVIAAKRSQHRMQLAERYGLDTASVWIAAIGRLVPVKNFSLLLRAAAAVRAKQQDVRFQIIIAGDGPLESALKSEAERLGIACDVRFLGHVSDVSSLYGSVDALALTSDSEGTPMVVLEAMAYALPVVATRVGGIPDQVVDGETALLCDASDVTGCTDALARIIVDDRLRERLGASGYVRAHERFSAARWADDHVALYKKLLARRQSCRVGS